MNYFETIPDGYEYKWAVFPKKCKKYTEKNAIDVGNLRDLLEKYLFGKEDVVLARVLVKKR